MAVTKQWSSGGFRLREMSGGVGGGSVVGEGRGWHSAGLVVRSGGGGGGCGGSGGGSFRDVDHGIESGCHACKRHIKVVVTLSLSLQQTHRFNMVVTLSLSLSLSLSSRHIFTMWLVHSLTLSLSL